MGREFVFVPTEKPGTKRNTSISRRAPEASIIARSITVIVLAASFSGWGKREGVKTSEDLVGVLIGGSMKE